MKLGRAVIGFVVIAMATLLASASAAFAAGPWRIRILDAETKQPLSGVIIVAVWYKSDGHTKRYFDSAEVVTGPDGWATISSRDVPKGRDARPWLDIYKRGHGTGWRFHGEETWRPHEFWKAEDAFKELERSGGIFELPPAKTREERRKALPSLPWGVPFTRMPMFMKALNQEAAYLGLPPYPIPDSEEDK